METKPSMFVQYVNAQILIFKLNVTTFGNIVVVIKTRINTKLEPYQL